MLRDTLRPKPSITKNTFVGNHASSGGAIGMMYVGATVIMNNLFVGNSASGQYELGGGAVPEPSALVALGFGLLPLGGAVLRRRSRRG